MGKPAEFADVLLSNGFTLHPVEFGFVELWGHVDGDVSRLRLLLEVLAHLLRFWLLQPLA